MAITLLDSSIILSGDTYTAPAGSNRVIIIFAADTSNVDLVFDSVRYNGSNLSVSNQIGPSLTGRTGTASQCTNAYYIPEAEILAGANTIHYYRDRNASVDHSGGIIVLTYSGVLQSTPVCPATNEYMSYSYSPRTLSVNHGANSGKYALSLFAARGNLGGETYTVSQDLGSEIIKDAANTEILSAHNITSLASDSETSTATVTWTNGLTYQDRSRTGHMFSVILEPFSTPTTLTIDQTEIEPGGNITGSYTGFTPGTPPTTPLVLSDGTNNINVTVTVSDNGDGTGTFSGTVPSLPSAGNSGSFILFGNVTATLDDA